MVRIHAGQPLMLRHNQDGKSIIWITNRRISRGNRWPDEEAGCAKPGSARWTGLQECQELLHDMNPRPPLPPFTEETARRKVQATEDDGNNASALTGKFTDPREFAPKG